MHAIYDHSLQTALNITTFKGTIDSCSQICNVDIIVCMFFPATSFMYWANKQKTTTTTTTTLCVGRIALLHRAGPPLMLVSFFPILVFHALWLILVPLLSRQSFVKG